MNDERLSAAVVGAGDLGRLVMGVLAQSPKAVLAGISDRDPAVAQQAAQGLGVPAFTDNRRLLAEVQPRVVFLCCPPQTSAEIIPICAGRGIHVWKRLPLARSLSEGAEMVRLMQRADLKLVVGTQRRSAGGYRTAARWKHRLEQIFLAQAHYLYNWGNTLGWHGDKTLAGGGALIEIGYHAIDLLVWILGLPEEVYGASSSAGNLRKATDGKRHPIYDTDDTAAAILRFRTGPMATIVTTRSSGPVSEELRLHGQGGSIAATAESCSLRGPDGETLDHFSSEGSAAEPLRRQIDAFLEAVITKAECYECSGLENLLNLAVIEAAYLCNRTSQPEHPARLLQTHGLNKDQCLSLCPAVL
jgi:predicted dehydrogenase